MNWRTVGTWTAAVLLLGAAPAIAAKPVLGFVDVTRIQQEYQRAQRVRNDLEAESQKYQAELQEGQQRLEEMEKRVASADAAARAATGSADVKTKLEGQRDAEESNLAKLRSEYAAKLKDRREHAQELDKELNETLLGEAKTTIAAIAKKHGLDGVIDSRASLYGALDLTGEVLKALNASGSAR